MSMQPFNVAMMHAARIEESKTRLQALGFSLGAAEVIVEEAAKEARQSPLPVSTADVLERKVREQMARVGRGEAPDG